MRQGLLFLLFGLATLPVSGQTLSKRLESESARKLAADAQQFGDPRRGAVAFYQPAMNCARCHEAEQNDRRLGPDLSQQREFQFESLVQSVLHPSADIKTGFETAVFQLTDGRQVQGILVEQTEAHFLVDQIEQPRQPLQIQRDDVEDWKRIQLSSMPAGLASQLTGRQQFLDLISYLADIAASGPARAIELRPAGAMIAMPLPAYESRVDHAGLIRGLDEDSLIRGAETFRLRCQSCHGSLDQEGSMPTSLRFATGVFKNGSDPYRLYQTLTHGYGMMNPQPWMVPQQKYEVIHYLREHFLRTSNPGQYFEVTKTYLAGLPAGDTLGPQPVENQPWTMMDYGHSLSNTIEVSGDGSNIAQKGIAIRLDPGPGGVESGSYWMMYEHDTLRVAGAGAATLSTGKAFILMERTAAIRGLRARCILPIRPARDSQNQSQIPDRSHSRNGFKTTVSWGATANAMGPYRMTGRDILACTDTVGRPSSSTELLTPRFSKRLGWCSWKKTRFIPEL